VVIVFIVRDGEEDVSQFGREPLRLKLVGKIEETDKGQEVLHVLQRVMKGYNHDDRLIVDEHKHDKQNQIVIQFFCSVGQNVKRVEEAVFKRKKKKTWGASYYYPILVHSDSLAQLMKG